jgi:hypothetical protein
MSEAMMTDDDEQQYLSDQEAVTEQEHAMLAEAADEHESLVAAELDKTEAQAEAAGEHLFNHHHFAEPADPDAGLASPPITTGEPRLCCGKSFIRTPCRPKGMPPSWTWLQPPTSSTPPTFSPSPGCWAAKAAGLAVP